LKGRDFSRAVRLSYPTRLYKLRKNASDVLFGGSAGLQPCENACKFKGLQPRAFLHMLPDALFPQPVEPRHQYRQINGVLVPEGTVSD